LDHLIVAAVSLGVSAVTVFSGFGLGTLLLPVFAIFFPVNVAVAATAVVHGANNVLKVSLFGKHADWWIVARFGIPAILAAFLGATVLGLASAQPPIAEYTIGGRQAAVTPVKLAIGLLMVVFALFDLLPRLRALRFDPKLLAFGGFVSGFFGGLSGHQGSLRSAFLAKIVTSAEVFVGTTAVISLFVDLARMSVYGATFAMTGLGIGLGGEVGWLVLTAIAAGSAGVLVGRQLVNAITMKTVRVLTGSMLLGVALGLASGLI
jgi:uncharacterized membrane protein YfcA